MAVSTDKSISIRTEGFDKNALLGDISASGGTSPATQNDVRQIIAEVRNSFNKFTQTQLTYAETANNEVEDENTEEIDIREDDSDQLDRIEDNTNNIVSKVGGIGVTTDSLATLGIAAGAALPAITAVSEMATGGGFFKIILNGLKKAFIFLIKNPVFIFAIAVLVGMMIKLLKPMVMPVINFFKTIGNFIKKIYRGIAYVVKKNFEMQKFIVSGMFKTIEWEITSLIKLDKLIWESVKKGWEINKYALMSEWEVAKIVFSSTIDSIKSIWNSVSEKFGNAIEFFKNLSLGEILNSIKSSINSILSKLGIDVQHEDRKNATDKAKDLTEERKKLEEKLKLSTNSAEERKRLEEAMRKNQEESAKLADKIQQEGLAERGWIEKGMSFLTRRFGGKDEKKEEKDALAAFAKNAKDEQKKNDISATAVPSKQEFSISDDNRYGARFNPSFTKWVMEKEDKKPEKIPLESSPIKPPETNNLGPVKLRDDSTPKGLEISADNGSEPEKFDNLDNIGDNDDLDEYLKNTIPSMFENKLNNIKIANSNEAVDKDYQIESNKAVMDEYTSVIKSMFDDFSKDRNRNDEELKKIFADGKISKEDMASYMSSRNNVEKVTGPQKIIVNNKTNSDMHRSL